MPLSKEEKARRRALTAMQTGRDYHASGSAIKALLEEIRAEVGTGLTVRAAASSSRKRVREAGDEQVLRVEQAGERVMQQIGAVSSAPVSSAPAPSAAVSSAPAPSAAVSSAPAANLLASPPGRVAVAAAERVCQFHLTRTVASRLRQKGLSQRATLWPAQLRPLPGNATPAGGAGQAAAQGL